MKPSRQMVVCLDHSRLGNDGWRRISGRPVLYMREFVGYVKRG